MVIHCHCRGSNLCSVLINHLQQLEERVGIEIGKEMTGEEGGGCDQSML